MASSRILDIPDEELMRADDVEKDIDVEDEIDEDDCDSDNDGDAVAKDSLLMK